MVYVPILKWKSGERIALSRLNSDVKDQIVPMLCVMKDADYEEFADQVRKVWGERLFYLDFHGGYYDIQLYNVLSNEEFKGINFIPTIPTMIDCNDFGTIKKLMDAAENGLAIRISPRDYDKAVTSVENLLKLLKLESSNADIIVDMEQIRLPESVLPSFSLVIRDIVKQLLTLSPKKIIVAGSSFPESISVPQNAITPILRTEMVIWDEVQKQYPGIIFGDYGADDPFDPIFDGGFTIIPTIRYTANNYWHIIRGAYNRKAPFDFSQFHDLSRKLINEKEIYCGQDFSWGDKIIFDCAKTKCAGVGENCNHGNLATWVKVAVNHHITYVVKQTTRSVSSDSA